MSEHDESHESRLLRAALQDRADRVQPTRPVVARARARVRRRRRALAAAGVAAVAAVVAGAIAFPRLGDDGVPTATADRGGGVSGGEWRTEYWKDVSVEVPADWGYDAAPYGGDGGANPTWCHGTLPGRGYVGRPVRLSDACTVYRAGGEAPTAPYVWFDAPVEPGTVRLPDGYTQQTVERSGVRITVATADPRQRNRIVDSIGGGEACLSEVDTSGPISHDAAPKGAVATRLRVCGYRASGEAPGAEPVPLVYAATYGHRALSVYQHSLEEHGARPTGCPSGGQQLEANWVVLELLDDAGDVVRQDVVHLVCQGGIVADTDTLEPATHWVPLTEATVRPWAGPATHAIIGGYGLDASASRWAWDYFIPPLG